MQYKNKELKVKQDGISYLLKNVTDNVITLAHGDGDQFDRVQVLHAHWAGGHKPSCAQSSQLRNVMH